MKKTICDRCKKDITDASSIPNIYFGTVSNEKDYCDSCYDAIISFAELWETSET